ncbi:Dyp-type peroxidase [Actinoplanes sichuanensis]|uniref:Dyp-type peroxidase n=1 Tax=Actinoplanes sichuanensis TaxID=512349 RepID=A0ABW4A656_9ACTN|nr:Dyp-type peroxidase [Actinoplanes sichuanensis]BEL05101.1 Dyp-type peroxidase [Actinoplanes sichuanensis]
MTATVPAALASADTTGEPLLALDDIQAHIVPGFPDTDQRFVGLRLPDGDRSGDAARAMLRELTPLVTSARAGLRHRALRRTTGAAGDGVAAAVALSARCLRALGHPELAAVDEALGVGMAERRSLRDPAPKNWAVGAPGAEIDILVILAADDETQLAVAEAPLLDPGHGLTVVHRESARRLPGDIEHFGFRDGISQPSLRGLVDADTPLAARHPMPPMPDGRAYARPGDVLLWPGQFLFGLPRQSSTSATRPADPRRVPDLARNGSLLVYRKLAQDVAAFRGDTAAMASALSVEPGTLRAWLVGRRPDGSPLSRDETDPGPGELNHFGYDDDVPPGAGVRGARADPDGARCPLAAHIRKVNPRDQETEQGIQQNTLTMMILRRGIPYGPLYEDAPDAERGLLFLCYQTDLARQFELLAQRWANRTDRPRQGLPNGLDMIIGRTRPGDPRQAPLPAGTVSTMVDYVTPQGGAYLFTPSIPALRALSEG